MIVYVKRCVVVVVPLNVSLLLLLLLKKINDFLTLIWRVTCILHQSYRMCLSLVYDILKLLSTVQFVNSLSYASDYVCLLELVNSSACFWRDYRVWYDAGMLHKCCRMCLSLLYDILRSLSNVHLWISKPPREWLCLLVGASHSCALTWPESVPRSSRPRCFGLVFAVPRKLYLIYACAMLLIREEFSPRGKRYSPQPLLLPVGNGRTGFSSSSDETGELSGCWAWVGASGAFWASFEDLPPPRVVFLLAKSCKLLAAANAKFVVGLGPIIWRCRWCWHTL